MKNYARGVALAAAVVLFGQPAEALELPKWADNDLYKLSLNVRARMEFANADGAEQSEAYTVRTLFGAGSKPYKGFSAYAELENSFTFDSDEYYDGVGTPTGQTTIADPTDTDLNQGYLKYENAEYAKLQVVGGRQRITLDDQRFIGNVGWRQNEQTFDAAQTSSSFGLDGLKVTYGYIWYVSRIFGNQGSPAQKNWDSKSHVIRVGYDFAPAAKLVVFSYLLDFDNSDPNSANSYGARLTGDGKLSEDWKGQYATSVAVQTDAGDNAVSYTAIYAAAEGGVRNEGIGGFALGYELLGSDDGDAVFVTPLATAHKFNGFADVFLNNGGPDGLQDLYFSYAPPLPGDWAGKLIYHRFWSDEGSNDLGGEVDFVATYPFSENFSILSKGGFFNGTSDGPADLWRWTLEGTLRI